MQLGIDLFGPIGLTGVALTAARQLIPGARDVLPGSEERLDIGGSALQSTGFNLRSQPTRDLLDAIEDPNTPPEVIADLQRELDTRNDEFLEREFSGMSEEEITRQLGRLFAERRRRESQPQQGQPDAPQFNPAFGR